MRRSQTPISSRISAERYAILVIVVSAHFLALTLFSKARSSRPDRADATAHHPESLQWLELVQEPLERVPEAFPTQTPLAERKAREKQPRVLHKASDASANPLAPEREQRSGGETEPSAQVPALDWRREAEQAAKSTVAAMARWEKRKCNDSRDRTPSPLLPSCEPPKDRFPWDPAPGRVGLAGGFLPYIRLGKRCVLGLGFFGCALGKLPEANGHAFDHMDGRGHDR